MKKPKGEENMKLEANTRCDECGVVTTVLWVGEEPYYESSTARLCRGCVQKAHDAIEKHWHDRIATLDELVAKAKLLPAMTEEERREQSASFAYGNMALTREFRGASQERLDELRQMCRRAAGLK